MEGPFDFSVAIISIFLALIVVGLKVVFNVLKAVPEIVDKTLASKTRPSQPVMSIYEQQQKVWKDELLQFVNQSGKVKALESLEMQLRMKISGLQEFHDEQKLEFSHMRYDDDAVKRQKKYEFQIADLKRKITYVNAMVS
ncbi:hypothetical protein BEN47_03570 [Hymenobacter lapidarius]|uniref:Uncharacterized protein n=1 Tax=Hymenobacter lapidarius TaxID=1908237 RepID=A0A1G1SXM7_9BACT|nr:hypothetical protein [Hymenobacter lapidarius]OGX83381.1 hypothetical protein BEN47_03570 [Hymenobacter lapidarius]